MCVCMRVFMCIYVCVGVCVYICVYMCVCVCVYIYVCVYVCVEGAGVKRWNWPSLSVLNLTRTPVSVPACKGSMNTSWKILKT